MEYHIVKIQKRRSQIRISIPIKIAKLIGLVDSEFVSIKMMKNNTLEVSKCDVETEKERGIQGHRD